VSDEDEVEVEVEDEVLKKKTGSKKRGKKAAKEVPEKKVNKKKTIKKKIVKKKATGTVKKNRSLKKVGENVKPIKNDGVLNSIKNKLDINEETKKEASQKPPFTEPNNIVDCNQQSRHTGTLSKKIYRISPKEASVQYTGKNLLKKNLVKKVFFREKIGA